MTSQWHILQFPMCCSSVTRKLDFILLGGWVWAFKGHKQGPVSGGSQGTWGQIVLTRGEEAQIHGQGTKFIWITFHLSQGLTLGHWCLSLLQCGIIFIKHFMFVQELSVINHLTLFPMRLRWSKWERKSTILIFQIEKLKHFCLPLLHAERGKSIPYNLGEPARSLMSFCSTTEVRFSVFIQNGLSYFSFWKKCDWYWGVPKDIWNPNMHLSLSSKD